MGRVEYKREEMGSQWAKGREGMEGRKGRDGREGGMKGWWSGKGPERGDFWIKYGFYRILFSCYNEEYCQDVDIALLIKLG